MSIEQIWICNSHMHHDFYNFAICLLILLLTGQTLETTQLLDIVRFKLRYHGILNSLIAHLPWTNAFCVMQHVMICVSVCFFSNPDSRSTRVTSVKYLFKSSFLSVYCLHLFSCCHRLLSDLLLGIILLLPSGTDCRFRMIIGLKFSQSVLLKLYRVI